MMSRAIYLLVLCCVLGCASAHRLPIQTTKEGKAIRSNIESSKVLQNHFVGLRIESLDDGAPIVQWNDDKFFTPASNTKVWTLAAALEVLGDSIAWMAEEKIGDRTVHFPLGDPSFLHPFLPPNPRIDDYFESNYDRGDTIYLSLSHYQDDHYGAGWMWDDRSYYFQGEKSVFPIHGNVIRLVPDTLGVLYEPTWMSAFAGVADVSAPYREEHANVFVLPYTRKRPAYVPMKVDENLIVDYFKSIGLVVEFVAANVDVSQATMIYSMPSDSLYSYFMEQSDNLMAEQLMLQSSMKRLGYMNVDAIIDTLMKNEFAQFDKQWYWRDGSGLSRYNLVTPSAMTGIIRDMIEKHGLARIKALLPAGGSGTLKNWYQYSPPRVFAKTGSLRYCHNLSGIFQARSGRYFVFSFMHNNFDVPSAAIKTEMQSILAGAIDRL